MRNASPYLVAALAVAAFAIAAWFAGLFPLPMLAGGAACETGRSPSPDVLLCEDFTGLVQTKWNIGSRGDSWRPSEFVVCRDGFGFGDRCAAWSHYLLFDRAWGFYGYDARRAFPARSEFYIRWYQYVSKPFDWGTLEDKSVMLHDRAETIVAYVGTNRNHLPTEKNSGPGVPFVANYQDLDWPETNGQMTLVNRFQNQDRNITLQPGRWYLFEWHVRLNTPGVGDGISQLWIDDATGPIAEQTLRMDYRDMRWLKGGDAGKHFSLLRLTVYHQRCDGVPNRCPPNGPGMLRQSHRWDQIVISTSRIGPMSAEVGDR